MNLEPLESPYPNRTVNGDAFGQGLKHALSAAVRVSIATRSGDVSCTGWLIAPRLVVFPAYALAGIDPVNIAARVALGHPSTMGWEDHADGKTPVETLEADFRGEPHGGMDLAILHLAGHHPVRPLQFRRKRPGPGEMALIVHHGMPSPERKGAQLSFAEIDESAGLRLRYRGLHQPGSGGAILYDMEWRFLGLHMVSTLDGASGATQAAVMAMLQRSRWWEQIAHYQRLANVVAVRTAAEAPDRAPVGPSPTLVRAALSFSIVRDALSEAERETLAPHVVDAAAGRWTLSPRARRQILAGVPLESLPAYLPQLEEADRRVIGPLLLRTPDALEQASEDDLARWLQAVRWFGGTEPGMPALLPDLPSPARIYGLLQIRRARGRLARIAGDDFVGRRDELATLQRWFDDRSSAPVSIWGMGGIGKSALVARFFGALPADTMLFWLDFDQAALAPDDKASVIAALQEQAAPQLGTRPVAPPAPFDADRESGDEAAVEAARTSLVRMLSATPGRRIVIMLDSFEAAQYSQRHQELWPVLEDLAREVAGIQVIVSGRAPVPTLQLHGEPAVSIPLAGLKPEDARDWLGRHGVPPGPVQDEVVRIAVGLPLVLKLAEHLIAAGGNLDDLPQSLPDRMVAGVLYERILDRVHNADFKSVAKGAIVLRRLSAEMVEPVFGGLPLALPAGPAAAWFPEFAREAALVEGNEDELCLRPEVRAAALSLLERQEPDLVREIDRRALAWYGARDTNEPVVAAERVYHSLRLGDVEGAVEAWRDGCAAYLQYAEETLAGAARDWLSRRLGTSESVADGSVEVWEMEAADRIAQSRASGQSKGTIGILLERAERYVGGALAFHDAYEDWKNDRKDAALGRLLTHGIDPTNRRSRDRAMLAALIHAERRDRAEAARILESWSDPYYWRDRKEGPAERAAVHAARVCLAAPIELEERVGAHGGWPAQVLAMDLLCEEWRMQRTAGAGSGSEFGIQLPADGAERRGFLENLENFRERISGAETAARPQDAGPPAAQAAPDLQDPVAGILAASWQRWNILADGAMVQVLEEALAYPAISPLEQSVVTVLALFAGIPGLELRLRERSLEGWLSYVRSRVFPPKEKGRGGLSGSDGSGSRTSADVRELRQKALGWCGPDLRPLRQLVQRFAGQFEEK